jgi:hypothetical protein
VIKFISIEEELLPVSNKTTQHVVIRLEQIHSFVYGWKYVAPEDRNQRALYLQIFEKDGKIKSRCLYGKQATAVYDWLKENADIHSFSLNASGENTQE